MSTLIAFSGMPGDAIYVEEHVQAVRAALATGSPQYAVLTQVPAHGDAFSRAEILLNTSRIAFVRAG